MNSTSGDYRSTIIDWFGQWQTPTATCDSGTYCKVQNSQLLGPGVLGTFDSTEAAPRFHRYGCTFTCATPGTNATTPNSARYVITLCPGGESGN